MQQLAPDMDEQFTLMQNVMQVVWYSDNQILDLYKGGHLYDDIAQISCRKYYSSHLLILQQQLVTYDTIKYDATSGADLDGVPW